MKSSGTTRLRAVVISLATIIAIGCARTSNSNRLPRGASVLHLAATNDIPTLDPALGYDSPSWQFEQVLFDTLVRYADADLTLVPDLAVEWEVSGDATMLRFKLRPDAYFTNGRRVVSADVRYAIERVLNPKTRSMGMRYFRGIVGAEDYIRGRTAHVTGIETPHPTEIIFRLAAPDPLFIHKLAMPFAAAVPREAVERWGEDFSRHPVGSGPFKLREWRSGQWIVLERNQHYFDPSRPKVDFVIEHIGMSQQLQWLRFEAGKLDVSGIPPAEFNYVMKTPRLRALTVKAIPATTVYIGMNTQMPPFNDARVRRAFNYAVNKEKLIAVLNGRGIVARSILPPGFPGHSDDFSGYPYNPARARQLLEAAGLAQGFAPTMWMVTDPTTLILGQSIQQDLAQVGVRAVLKPVALGPLLQAVRQPRTVQTAIMGWNADFPDPQNFLEVMLSRHEWGSNNDTFFYDPRVERLLAEAAPVTDLARRYQLYHRVEQIAMREAPYVVLYHPITYVIRQPWVRGLALHPTRPPRLDIISVTNRPEKLSHDRRSAQSLEPQLQSASKSTGKSIP